MGAGSSHVSVSALPGNRESRSPLGSQNDLRAFIKTGSRAGRDGIADATKSVAPLTKPVGQMVGDNFVESGSVNSWQPRYSIGSTPDGQPYLPSSKARSSAAPPSIAINQNVSGNKTLLGT